VTGAQQMEEFSFFICTKLHLSYTLFVLVSQDIYCGIIRQKRIPGILCLALSGKQRIPKMQLKGFSILFAQK
jgi:hypothetical protein